MYKSILFGCERFLRICVSTKWDACWSTPSARCQVVCLSVGSRIAPHTNSSVVSHVEKRAQVDRKRTELTLPTKDSGLAEKCHQILAFEKFTNF